MYFQKIVPKCDKKLYISAKKLTVVISFDVIWIPLGQGQRFTGEIMQVLQFGEFSTLTLLTCLRPLIFQHKCNFSLLLFFFPWSGSDRIPLGSGVGGWREAEVILGCEAESFLNEIENTYFELDLHRMKEAVQ